MNWWLPPQASNFAPRIDGMFTAILIITAIPFFLVEIGVIWFVFKYRGRPGQKGHYTHGNTRLEMIWTAIPAVTMVALGLISNSFWVQIKGRNSVPADAYPVGVHAKQFEWWVTLPGPDGKLGRTVDSLISKANPTGLDTTDADAKDDIVIRNQLHLPAGRPIVAYLTAEDVIHSFYVPEFRVRQDIVPGLHIKAWFVATVPGKYEIGCSQLCGLGHYKMRAQVTVHTQADFDAWAKEHAPQPQAGGE
ncbi:MAG TPA: cytochrome c oxidase subunit II [Gemmatimonadales bacterium]|nr:cytochrome c oxidase subunit II [Gemmatimonadales bacterium]